MSNSHALGQVLYTDYALLFQIAGIILLVAMIGAIVLTLRDRGRSRRQDIGRQTARTSASTLVMMDVVTGAGAPSADYMHPLVEETEPEVEEVSHGGGHH